MQETTEINKHKVVPCRLWKQTKI